MKKAVIFDNDGILVNTEHLYFKATQEILASQGADLTLDIFIESNIKSNRSAWHLIDKSPQELKALKEKRNQRYTELLSEGDLTFPGIREALAEISKHYRLCIVTTSRKMHFEAIHQWTDYLPHFEFIITVDDVTNSKPHPEPYLKALEKLGLNADECFIIEDSFRGLKSAQAAGVDCIMIRNEYSQYQEFDGALDILENISQLPAILASYSS